MAEEKKITTGYIGNALRSAANDHTTTFADEVFDTEKQKYQSDINEDLEQAIEAETARATAAEEAIIYNVSALNGESVFESISALLRDSNLNTLIPTSVRHGGMIIKFIQGSEKSSDNKYVQYRLMSTAWSTVVTDWQGIDNEPTAGSDNLVKSGGVANKLAELEPKIIDSDKYIKIELDKENRILSCTKTDGTKYVYLATDFINGLKSKGKDVITTDDFTQEIRDRISLLPNETKAEFVKVLLDSENKLIESIDKNGNKTFYGDITIKGKPTIAGVPECITAQYLRVLIDESNKMIWSVGKEGNITIYGNVSVEGNLYNEELKNVKETADYKSNPFPSYKLHNFRNPIFCGDSVTAGYWVEGTEEHRDTSTGSDEFNRYPTIFGQFYPHMNITVKARGGISATQWLTDFYPTIDFSEYDMVVIELGYNGLLSYNDIDIEGTNTNSYKKIVQGVRTQNQTAEIILVISSHSAFVTGWKSILDKFAEDYRCKVIDLTSKKYLNLDDAKYHGWSSATFDWAHFTRKGYRAKAYVVAREIADVLTDDTYYI